MYGIDSGLGMMLSTTSLSNLTFIFEITGVNELFSNSMIFYEKS
jgi:hypothetical protein